MRVWEGWPGCFVNLSLYPQNALRRPLQETILSGERVNINLETIPS